MTVLLPCLLFFSSCAQESVYDRIEQNRSAFEALPLWEKDKVVRGEIASGMSPTAVQFAWGTPSSISQGQENNVNTLRWSYSVQTPVESTAWGMGGTYWGGPRYGPYYSPSMMYTPVTTYIPQEVGFVLFKKNKVVSWQKNQ